MYSIRMIKQKITLSVDDEVVAKAKEKMWNLSEIAESAMREKMNQKKVIIEDSEVCAYCKIKGEKETREDIKKEGYYSKPNKLVWLYPYEEWICNKCLRTESMKLHTY